MSSMALHGVAVFACYTAYAVLQERIIKHPYDGVQFTSTALLILTNRVLSLGMGTALLVCLPRPRSDSGVRVTLRARLAPQNSLKAYSGVAILIFLSTACQWEGLRHVSLYVTSYSGQYERSS